MLFLLKKFKLSNSLRIVLMKSYRFNSKSKFRSNRLRNSKFKNNRLRINRLKRKLDKM
jgi:hypothetical protein